MLPLVATGKCWILGVKRPGTRRNGAPGSEPRASETQGKTGSGQKTVGGVGWCQGKLLLSPHSQGPRQLSPWVPLLPGGFLGHSRCCHSVSSQLPHDSDGLVGGQRAAISSHPVGHSSVRQGQAQATTPAPYPSWTCLLESYPMGLQLQDTTKQEVMRSQRDQAWLGQPQSIVDGDGRGGGSSWEL